MMNKYNLIFIILSLVLVLASVSAETIRFEHPDDSSIYIKITYDTEYDVDAGDNVDFSFDIDYVNNENNNDVTINTKLYVDESNDEDFDIDDDSVEITLEDGEDDTIEFSVDVDEDTDDDTYDFVLEFDIDWEDEDSNEEIYFELAVDEENNDDEIELKIVNPEDNDIYVVVKSDQESYDVDSGDSIDIDFEFEYENTTNNNDVKIIAHLVADEDDEFDIEDDYQELTLNPNESNELTFEIDVDNSTDSDDYDFTLELEIDWGADTTEKDIDLELRIDELDDDLEISLSKTIFCTGDEIFYTELEFENESNDDYLVKNIKLDNADLWPKLEDTSIMVDEDEDESITVDFVKTALPGTYELEFEADLYYGGSTSDSKNHYETEFKITIQKCEETNVTLISNNTGSYPEVKPNEPAYLYYTLKNQTNKDMPVVFSVSTDDDTMSITVSPKTKIVPPYSEASIKVIVIPTDRTTPGIKTVNLSAITQYGVNLKQTGYVNVVYNNFDIEYNVPVVKLGLKATQNITITNRGNSSTTITLRATGSEDTIYLNKSSLTLNPDESAIVKLNIVPKSLGYKSFNLELNNVVYKFSKTMYYSVSGKASTPIFIKSVKSDAYGLKNANNTLPIILSNQYDFDITLKLNLEGNGISSMPQEIILNAKDTKAMNLSYFAGDINPGTYTFSLITRSELGTTTLPIKLKIIENLSSLSGLELTEIPLEVYFSEGQEFTYNWKVTNHNNSDLTDAVIKVIKNDELISTRVFAIGAGATENIETILNINEDEEFIGKVILIAGNNETQYDVIFTPNNGFMSGLFSLGVGSTLGIILGILIIILVLVIAFWPNKKKVKCAEHPNLPEDHCIIKKAM